MCDYSLHHVASRPARVGDKLISASFLSSGTRGFAAIGEPNVAVCLLPGTELAFQENLECEAAYGFGFKRLQHKAPGFDRWMCISLVSIMTLSNCRTVRSSS